MGQLIVVRHGQASLMKADYDELSDHGRAQAAALGEHLAHGGYGFDAVYTGPARRHHDTASLAAEAAGLAWPKAQELPELDEHDAFGLFRAAAELKDEPELVAGLEALSQTNTHAERSRLFQVVFEQLMERWLSGRLEPEGVETWPQFRDRVRSALRHMVDRASGSSGTRVLAFSSVGPLAVLLQQALQTDDIASFRTAWRLRNASLTTFVFDGRGRFTLDAFNALPHLPQPGAWTFR